MQARRAYQLRVVDEVYLVWGIVCHVDYREAEVDKTMREQQLNTIKRGEISSPLAETSPHGVGRVTS